MPSCFPGMFADLTDEELLAWLQRDLTACEEMELMREAQRRGLL